MKITFGGRYRVYELGNAIDRVFQNLLVNGVEEVYSVSIYLQLLREQRSLHLVDEHERMIEHLKVDAPTNSTFEHREIDYYTTRKFEPVSGGIHIKPR